MTEVGSRRFTALAVAALSTLVMTACGPMGDRLDPAAQTSASSSAAPTSVEPTASPTPASSPTATPTGTPKPSPKPSQPRAVLEPGAKGEKVRELQHRLTQLEWYSGKITGTYAKSTTTGVQGFQDKRKLKATGVVDQKTWTSLIGRTRTPTKAERHNRLVAGPAIMKQGSSGDRVRDLQARLKQVGWYAPKVTGSYGSVTAESVRGFQGKRAIPVTGAVDQRTWDRLTAMTRTPTDDALHNRLPKPSASGLDSRCMTGRALCVSKTSNSLVWVVNGKAQLRMDVRFGSAELPTREGAFSVGWKSRDHVSTIYHTKMPYAMFFSGGQAVHYSPDFAARGYSGASHGCVNVRNLAGIQTLFSQVRVGDKVIVYR